MAERLPSPLPPPSPEHRRIAAGQFERANQVVATGNFDYAIKLLLSCCKLDPANLIYRQTLRRTVRKKYEHKDPGGRLAWLTTWPAKARLKAARQRRDHLKVLEYGEHILARNPGDLGTYTDLAESAMVLGLVDLAVWTLEQARQKHPKDLRVNRSLARLYEKRGNFTQAIALWEFVAKHDLRDVEAQNKAKNLAASETIARGHYADKVGTRRDDDGGDEASPKAMEPTDTESNETKLAPHAPAASRVGHEAETLRARIKANPTSTHAYLQLAALYRRNEQPEQAREVLQEGLPATGNAFELSLELAELDIEPFRRNLAHAEKRLLAHPDDKDLRTIRIRLLKEINARELDLYRRKADRYPTEMAHRVEMGIRLLRAGQVDEAIQALQAARGDARQQWRALTYLGHCFKSRSNWRLARRNFEEALKHLPAEEQALRKDILYQLAQGSAQAGELATAVDLAHELANLDFSYRDIGKLLDEWQTRLEQRDNVSR
jgi:tetratricopeptide (TPR) repeat protein